MDTLTVLKHWRDVNIDPGVRPNAKFTYSNGTVVGRAVNNRIIEAVHEWPAADALGVVALQLAEVAITATGLTDLFEVDTEETVNLPIVHRRQKFFCTGKF